MAKENNVFEPVVAKTKYIFSIFDIFINDKFV